VSIDTPRPPLDSAAVSKLISQYWRVSVVEVTGSTQDDLAQKVADKKAVTGDVIATEFQSAGRGRLDRKFEAPQSSALMFSFYVEPERDKSEWSFLPLLTGLSAIFSLTELDPECVPQLKWPNDILINDGKVGGIIAQVSDAGVVIGIGINVAMSESELPVTHATSLAIHSFAILDRNQILARFLTTFEELLTRWQRGEDLRHLYCEHSATIGRSVKVEHPDGSNITGKAVGITPAGELILEDGSRVTVGDVVHLR
jgi:BirA family transcriptional regulator, biotin operon repressor / biotin---[acetyl-CoA-carboxylase] ligase